MGKLKKLALLVAGAFALAVVVTVLAILPQVVGPILMLLGLGVATAWWVFVLLSILLIGLLEFRRQEFRKVRTLLAGSWFRLAMSSASLVAVLGLVGWAKFFVISKSEELCIQRAPEIEQVLTLCQLPDAKERGLLRGDHVMQWEEFLLSLENAPKKTEHDPRDMFPSSDGRSYYLTMGLKDTETWPAATIKVSRATHKIEVVHWMYTPYTGECFPETGTCFLTSPKSSAIFVIDDKANVIREVLHFPGLGPANFVRTGSTEVSMVLAPDSIRGALAPEYLVPNLNLPTRTYDFGCNLEVKGCGVVLVYDFQKMEVVRHAGFREGTITGGAESYFVHATPPPYEMLLYGIHIRRVMMTNEKIGEHRDVATTFYHDLLSTSGATGATSDPERRETYVAYVWTGDVGVFDFDMGYIRRIGLPMGTRFVQFDSRRRLLYAGNYNSGEVLVVEPETGLILKKWSVGDCLRALHFVPESDEILVATGSGFVVIHVDESEIPTSTRIASAR